MQAKRRPVKSVYGKARVTQKSNLLWDEAISASPIVRKVVSIPQVEGDATAIPAFHLTEKHDEQAALGRETNSHESILRSKDPNVVNTTASAPVLKKNVPNRKAQTEEVRPHNLPFGQVSGEAAFPAEPVISDPILASTPIRAKDSQSQSMQELTRSHIRFDSSGIDSSNRLGSDAESECDDTDSESSLSSIGNDSNNDLGDLTAALGNLTTDQSGALGLADESTIAEESDLCDYQTLLSLCDQSQAQDFTVYVQDLQDRSKLQKLGEASFSEVFLGKDRETNEETVYKVIPFGEDEDEVPINDIVQEVRISRAMSSLRGYVTLKSVVVVQGSYPTSLLRLWDAWHAEFNSESDRPEKYKSDQRYCVIALEHGGVDLEHYQLSSWAEARWIFEQIVETLALGEREKQFEHRDLHWGNVLVKDQSAENDSRVTVIDYTLSRALVRDQLSDIAFYGFSDRAIFEAEGEDYQFDIYRLMRDAITDGQDDPSYEDWALFHPTTNVLWLHYLVDKILHEKDLKKPGLRQTKRNPTVNEAEVAAWRMLDRTWTLLNPRRRYNQDELAIDSAERVRSLLMQTE